MKSLIVAISILLSWATVSHAAGPAPLTTLKAIHALTSLEAKQALPVAFEATVTYYRGYERTLFVQDGDIAIFIQPKYETNLSPGDRILIKGVTRESFRPIIIADEIKVLSHTPLPKPPVVNFDELIHARYDCRMVSINAVVHSADLAPRFGNHTSRLQLITDGGAFEAVIDAYDPAFLNELLDAQVMLTGVVSGAFDGKMQQTGIVLHISSYADVQIINHATASPWALPVTPMDEIIAGYHISDHTQRARVHGSITYYQPGSAVVLEDGARSLWVQTRARGDFHVGDVVDVTGFPATHDGFLTLLNAEILDNHVQHPVTPKLTTARDLNSSHNLFDLVSLEGQVVAEVRDDIQDEYVIVSGDQQFSAIMRHPAAKRDGGGAVPPMKQIPVGSKVRVTGVCVLDDSNPFDALVPFDILLRTYDDITVITPPSLLNIRNLILLAGLLFLVVIAAGALSWRLERRVRLQTTAMASRVEEEAALERQRSRILEDINGSEPLAGILEQIIKMVSAQLNGAPCWCWISDGATLGDHPSKLHLLRLISVKISARSGPALGTLYAALNPQLTPKPGEEEALRIGARLATLAIETRRLFTDLVRRSEYDLLTEVRNRFSLDKLLDARIAEARSVAGIFGLIYIDLDKFKLINDRYGHHVGDLYLQKAALRMKHQLRAGDTLARVGGDEFVALLPMVRCRADVEEVALRIERCFDERFVVEEYIVKGTASVGFALYPEDGITKSALLSAADAAMYVEKNQRHKEMPPPTPITLVAAS